MESLKSRKANRSKEKHTMISYLDSKERTNFPTNSAWIKMWDFQHTGSERTAYGCSEVRKDAILPQGKTEKTKPNPLFSHNSAVFPRLCCSTSPGSAGRTAPAPEATDAPPASGGKLQQVCAIPVGTPGAPPYVAWSPLGPRRACQRDPRPASGLSSL